MARSETRSVYAPKSSKCNLSCEHITTMDFFRLQPIYCGEQLPGSDQFNVMIKSFVQAAPFATKVFSSGGIHLDLHAFFVPYALICPDWTKYYNGASYSTTSTNLTPPTVNAVTFSQIFGCGNVAQSVTPTWSKDVLDKRAVFGSLGYPTFMNYNSTFASSAKFNLLPALAYQQIWWNYYRDSQNIDELSKDSYIPSSMNSYSAEKAAKVFTPRYRCFRKDYISTLLKNPQLGANGASASVTSSASGLAEGATQNIRITNDDGYFETTSGNADITRDVSAQVLRGAIATQRYLERLGVSGTRPLERLMAEFGKYPEREKLNIPQFIGGTSVNLNIDGLTNTSSANNLGSSDVGNAFGINDDTSYMGQQMGMSNGYNTSDSWHHTSNEYGCFMVVASIIPDFKYLNVVDRQFLNGAFTAESSPLDYFHPDFQDMGYQECLLSEVAFPSYTDAVNNGTWKNFDPFQVVGYQPKFEHLRHGYNRISGQFMEHQLRESLPQMVLTRSLPELYDPSEVQASLNLTTSDAEDAKAFDNHFCITDETYDHFICKFDITNNAVRPITGSSMPTELTHIINSGMMDVSNGGVKL